MKDENGNTGDGNTGYWNTGRYNTGHFNHFNTTDATLRMFNKDTGLYRKDINLPAWLFGLKVVVAGQPVPYKTAWKNLWATLDVKQKKEIEKLPNFNAEIFEEITGINVYPNKTKKEKLAEQIAKLTKEMNKL